MTAEELLGIARSNLHFADSADEKYSQGYALTSIAASLYLIAESQVPVSDLDRKDSDDK